MNEGANNSPRRKVMGNYVNVCWSDGYEDYPVEYDSNLVRVSRAEVCMGEGNVSTYIDYTPNYFTDTALLSLVDAVVDSTKKVEEAYGKSDLAENQTSPAMYFGFDVKAGLEDLEEREALADMGIVDDYYDGGDRYTSDELVTEYLPKYEPITCLGVEIKYDEGLDTWKLPDGFVVQYPVLKAYKNERPVLIDGMYAVMQYLVRERTK